MYWTLIRCGPGRLKRLARPARPGWKSHPLSARSRPKRTQAPQRRDSIDDLLYGQAGRIDHFGIGRGLQWGYRAGRIPQVPLGDLARKGGKANIRPLVFQLLIAAQSPLVGAGGKKYFETGLWKYHGA